MPLPMIQNIVTLPPHEREDSLKHISDGDTTGVHDELAAKFVPVVIEMWKFYENTAKLYFKYILW